MLFDPPGPRARRRHAAVSAAAALAVAVAMGYVVLRFVHTGQFSELKWQQFTEPAVQRSLLDGLAATLKAAALAAALALPFGVVFAGARLVGPRPVRAAAAAVVELFRAVPLLILIFFAYYVPLDAGFALPKLWSLVLGLTLYNGSVLAEIVRAGILAVPRGQSEAAAALGLRPGQVLRLVLLPQALRAMLPAIVSQLVVLLKDTALGFIITYPELLFQAKLIGGRLVYELPYVPTYLVTGAVYIGICGALSYAAHRLGRPGRRTVPAAGARSRAGRPTPPGRPVASVTRPDSGSD
jgi:glutamate transport system permease protein